LIDIRYHIYSLAAVFLALALGVVIGTSFARSAPGAGKEREVIASYEQSMQRLKQKLEATAAGSTKHEQLAEKSEEFCRAVLPIVVKDRLQWRNVAIVQTGDYDDLSGSVKHALELAGAKVVGIADISRTFAFDDDKRVAAALTSCGVVPPDDGRQSREKLFGLIAETICSGKYSDMMALLEKAGIAKFSGDFGGYSRLKLVVLVGGATAEGTNGADKVDADLLAQLTKRGVTVVGCEATDVISSYIAAWHKTGIATVDNADTAIGQTAIICALAGEKAKFGVKDSADRLIPQTLETK